ncbi:hypothetical protein HK101_002737 [Irineochytrium annulatum]|nr:hypothetical protein HK101_002737 [Irineochytrium annulatum]
MAFRDIIRRNGPLQTLFRLERASELLRTLCRVLDAVTDNSDGPASLDQESAQLARVLNHASAAILALQQSASGASVSSNKDAAVMMVLQRISVDAFWPYSEWLNRWLCLGGNESMDVLSSMYVVSRDGERVRSALYEIDHTSPTHDESELRDDADPFMLLESKLTMPILPGFINEGLAVKLHAQMSEHNERLVDEMETIKAGKERWRQSIDDFKTTSARYEEAERAEAGRIRKLEAEELERATKFTDREKRRIEQEYLSNFKVLEFRSERVEWAIKRNALFGKRMKLLIDELRDPEAFWANSKEVKPSKRNFVVTDDSAPKLEGTAMAADPEEAVDTNALAADVTANEAKLSHLGLAESTAPISKIEHTANEMLPTESNVIAMSNLQPVNEPAVNKTVEKLLPPHSILCSSVYDAFFSVHAEISLISSIQSSLKNCLRFAFHTSYENVEGLFKHVQLKFAAEDFFGHRGSFARFVDSIQLSYVNTANPMSAFFTADAVAKYKAVFSFLFRLISARARICRVQLRSRRLSSRANAQFLYELQMWAGGCVHYAFNAVATAWGQFIGTLRDAKKDKARITIELLEKV